MPIKRLLHECSFDPDQVSVLVSAYEAALELLRPKDQTDAVKELVAKKVFEIARSGECDPPKLCARALIELGLPVTEQPARAGCAQCFTNAQRGRCLTCVKHYRRVGCDKMSTGGILFTCPFNGQKVHLWIEDEPVLAAEHYVAVECGSCRSVHFVVPSTGRVMGETVRPKSVETGPVGTT